MSGKHFEIVAGVGGSNDPRIIVALACGRDELDNNAAALIVESIKLMVHDISPLWQTEQPLPIGTVPKGEREGQKYVGLPVAPPPSCCYRQASRLLWNMGFRREW